MDRIEIASAYRYALSLALSRCQRNPVYRANKSCLAAVADEVARESIADYLQIQEALETDVGQPHSPTSEAHVTARDIRVLDIRRRYDVDLYRPLSMRDAMFRLVDAAYKRHVRGDRHLPPLSSVTTTDEDAYIALSQLPTAQESIPWQEAAEEEILEDLKENWSEEDAGLFILRLQGYTLAEIATRLNRSESALSVRLARIREYIRQKDRETT